MTKVLGSDPPAPTLHRSGAQEAHDPQPFPVLRKAAPAPEIEGLAQSLPPELGPLVAANEGLRQEIARLTAALFANERFRASDAASHIDDLLLLKRRAEQAEATITDRDRQIDVLRDMHKANAQKIARLRENQRCAEDRKAALTAELLAADADVARLTSEGAEAFRQFRRHTEQLEA